MKTKYVPLNKRSKREQKMYYAEQRRDWGNVNPAIRKIENAKLYSRKKKGQWYADEPLSFYLCGIFHIRVINRR